MDFAPLGSSHFLGTDQITSNTYIDSGSTYNIMMNDAKIRQRKSLPYAEEITRLQMAKASKLQELERQDDLSKERFTTAKRNMDEYGSSQPPRQNESFHGACSYGIRNIGNNVNDDIYTFILIILLVIIISMIKSIYSARCKIDKLTRVIQQNRSQLQPINQQPYTPLDMQQASQPASTNPGLMGAAAQATS